MIVEAPKAARPTTDRAAFFFSSAPWIGVLVASIAFRLPPLLNAAGTNSDAAVVGLQAMHLLRGEWSPFLWGSGYQTSVDAIVAAIVFLFTGPSPLALMASTLAGHVTLTWLAYDMVRRSLPEVGERREPAEDGGIGGKRPRSFEAANARATAAILVLPLVFTPDPVHTYVLFPPRQASLTLAFFALWLIHGAPSSRRPRARFAAGGVIAGLAAYADPYALLFLPAHALLGALAVRSGDPRPDRATIRDRAIALVGGAIAGIVPYLVLRGLPRATHGQTSLTFDVLRHNFELLVDPCLPWVLSAKVYAARSMSDYGPWVVGPAMRAFQIVAAVVFVAALVAGAAICAAKATRPETRRIGLAGAILVPAAIFGFLLSPMVMDHFSSRYLAAIILVAPLCLAPLAARIGPRRLALVIAPYLVSAAISGWVSYRPFTLAVHPNLAADARLGVALRERGIRYVVADYWASYRLTFAWRENPIVVPKNEVEDRYKPYRDAFEAEPVVAYVFDAYRSRENLAETEAAIARGDTPFEPHYDRFVIENFTALILVRRTPATRVASRR